MGGLTEGELENVTITISLDNNVFTSIGIRQAKVCCDCLPCFGRVLGMSSVTTWWGTTLMEKMVFACGYHQQFIESAKAIAINLSDKSTRLSIHQALSEFFKGHGVENNANP